MNIQSFDGCVQSQISSFLTPADLARSQRVSRHFNNFGRDVGIHGYNPVEGSSIRPLLNRSILRYAASAAFDRRWAQLVFEEGYSLGSSAASAVWQGAIRLLAIATTIVSCVWYLIKSIVCIGINRSDFSIGLSIAAILVGIHEKRARGVANGMTRLELVSTVCYSVVYSRMFAYSCLSVFPVVPALAPTVKVALWLLHAGAIVEGHRLVLSRMNHIGDWLERQPHMREAAGVMIGRVLQVIGLAKRERSRRLEQ